MNNWASENMLAVTVYLIVGVVLSIMYFVGVFDKEPPTTKKESVSQLMWMLSTVAVPFVWFPAGVLIMTAVVLHEPIVRLIDIYHILNQKEPEDE